MGLTFKFKHNIVHTDILNGSIEIKQSFFDGIMNNLKFDEITVNGQLGTQGLYYIASLLGYNVNVIEKINNTNIFTLNISSYNKNIVYDIKEVEYKDKYVYDLQTENHHLNAGVGGIVVHNCDGIHIKGLIINFIHSLFPTLLEREQPFVVSMQTPIVKVFLKTKNILFYDERKFKEYYKINSDKKLTVKYYKGLGTSSDAEVLETFGKRVVELLNDKDALVNMNKVFHKSHADDRKLWIGNYNPNADLGIEIDESPITQVNISDFIDKEMIKFSIADCARSIPNMMDGFKESHRKTLHACFLKKLNYGGQTLKVAQLAGFVAEKTNYHHGEQNLFDTITKMAHDFPGSNNIPLLFRDGQFGSRNSLGKDAANARYIFTKLDILTRLIFRPEDDCLLERVVDDGDIVEPKFYVPIIPMVLVNGIIAGIGTGFSSNLPAYNPLELIECIKIWLKNRTVFEQGDKENITKISLLPELKPWYRGFEGRIEKESEKRYTTYGRIIKEGQGKDKVLVDELPISMSIDKFKEFLEEQLEIKNIKTMKNYSTPTKVNFVITENNDGIKCNEENLKLKSCIYTSNMVLFTEKEQINKFDTIDDIIESFCTVRYEYYIKRKEYILNDLEKELKTSENKARFLKEVMNDELIIFKRDESDISAEMEKKGYGKEEDSFDYLLRLQVRSFTTQKIQDLETEIENIKKQIKNNQNTSEKQMWINDLDVFTKAYNTWLKSTEKSTKATKAVKAKK
jgi:DNA topoisomerase-2